MELPKLIEYFPATNSLAELYGGWLEGPFFKKVFNAGEALHQINDANLFLKANGFNVVFTIDDFADNNVFEDGSLSLDFNTLGENTLLLVYEQPVMINPIESVYKLIDLFREERDWKQFHDAKNLAMALSSETGELLDHFLWDRDKNINIDKASNEMADIFFYLLLLSKELKIDLLDAVVNKMVKNGEKYPVEKAKGKANKYNEL